MIFIGLSVASTVALIVIPSKKISRSAGSDTHLEPAGFLCHPT